jgi:uncharacterized phage protein gp47/JayE
MASPPPFEDLFAAGRNEALARPTRLTPEVMDLPGSDVNILLATGAAQAQEIGAYAQGELNACRLRTAGSVSEEALEQYGASELGGETRRGSLSAIVPLTFQRLAGAGTTIPARSLMATKGGVTFELLLDLVFAAGQAGPLEVDAFATTAGPGGNVPAHTITEILTGGTDLTLTVTNREPAAGGRPEQTIEEYQAQLQTAFVRAAKGTLAAIEAAAANVDGVVSARAYEVLSGTAQTGRVVAQILGAGRSTNSALVRRVRLALDDVRAAGIPVAVQGLNGLSVTVRAQGLVISAGYSAPSVLGEAARAVVSTVNNTDAGAKLYRASITAALAGIEGLEVPDGSLLTPAEDVQPEGDEFVETSLDLVVLLTTDPAP